MQKIRVLECIRQGKVGGGESHLLSLVENLDKSQFEPVVLSFTDGPMIDRLQQMGVESYVIFTEKPFDVTKWGRVKDLLKESRVDLVHAHGTRACSNVLWAAQSLGIPVVYTVHGWSFHEEQRPAVRLMRTWGEKYLTSRTKVNITVSNANLETGKKHIDGFRAVQVNHGIDQEKFSPARSFKDIRAELGIGKDIILVLFIARFTVQKQPLSMIRAFLNARRQFPGMHLLMVGDGDQKEEGLRLAEESGEAAGHITFQPFRPDVPDILAAADIFVLPSLWEGLPIGLLEAMSMGKAVIASDVDGTGEVMRHGENGWLVKKDNLVDNLAAALVRLATDEEQRRRFSQKAMETVSKQFSLSVMAHTVENIYKNVLTNHTENNGI